MTKLSKTIIRELPLTVRGVPVLIVLDPNGGVSLRVKGEAGTEQSIGFSELWKYLQHRPTGYRRVVEAMRKAKV